MPPSPPSTLWSATVGGDAPRYDDPATGDVDVAIVGAGYTGLWTALSLVARRAGAARRRRRPATRSASGPAGATAAGALRCCRSVSRRLAARHGREAAIAAAAGDVSTRSARSAGFADGGRRRELPPWRHDHAGPRRRSSCAGSKVTRLSCASSASATTTAACSPPTRRRRSAGPPTSSAPLRPALRGASTRCGSPTPSPPRRPVAGCASSRAPRSIDVGPRGVVTDRGTVRAPTSSCCATEAYTRQLPGRRRDVLPIYSMMVGSEPLSADAVGRDRPRRPADVHERRQHDHLRPAHGRRPRGVRRPGSAVPLRVADRRPSSTPTSGCASAARARSRELFPRAPATSSSRSTGAGRSACPATGIRTCASTGRPGSPARAGTSVTAWRPRTSPGARSPTSILGRDTDLTRPADRRAPVAALGARAAPLAGSCARVRRGAPRARGESSTGPLAAAWARRRSSTLTSH